MEGSLPLEREQKHIWHRVGTPLSTQSRLQLAWLRGEVSRRVNAAGARSKRAHGCVLNCWLEWSCLVRCTGGATMCTPLPNASSSSFASLSILYLVKHNRRGADVASLLW